MFLGSDFVLSLSSHVALDKLIMSLLNCVMGRIENISTG